MERIGENFGCGVVSAWEERIWLDRREIARPAVPAADQRRSGARFGEALRRFIARMQLGPVAGQDGL